MRRVFVDVDDTLIIFGGEGTHHYGVVYGESYEPNNTLIDKLRGFDGEVVIWSGGGKFYAQHVADMVLPKDLKYTAEDKEAFWKHVNKGDIVVDDDKWIRKRLEGTSIHFFEPFEDWNINIGGEP